MRILVALIVMSFLSADAIAAEIRKGAVMQVKADSIWFEKAAGLTDWQKRKKIDTPAFFASYQERLLSNRVAWQFIGTQTVKILKVWPRRDQAHVEMRTPGGRLSGSKWFVDAGAIER